MRHLNRYNNFLIKESLTDINQIKELIDDYFLEHIESEETQSQLKLDYWVDPKEIGKESISMSSSPSIGDIPCYRYELKFVKSLPVDKVKTIQSRLNVDKQFKIISFSATSGYVFTNSDISEHTTIGIRFSYLLNTPISQPNIITQISDKLKSKGFNLNEIVAGNHYSYQKYDEWVLDPRESKLFPMDSFYARKMAGAHIPKPTKLDDIKNGVLKLYEPQLNSDWNMIKSLIPGLPKPTFKSTNSDKDVIIYLESKIDKIEWSVRLELLKKSQTETELIVVSRINYYDRINQYSDY